MRFRLINDLIAFHSFVRWYALCHCVTGVSLFSNSNQRTLNVAVLSFQRLVHFVFPLGHQRDLGHFPNAVS